MEASTNFHGYFTSMETNLLPWKVQWKLIPPTSSEVSQLPWELPPTSMDVNSLPFTCMEVAIEVASFSIYEFIYFHESCYLCTIYIDFHLHLLPWKLPPKSVKDGSTPASMQAAPVSMEATKYFHVLPSTSIYFHGNSHGSCSGGNFQGRCGDFHGRKQIEKVK